MEKHMAVCPYCGAGCKMNLVVENGQVIDAEGLPGITKEGSFRISASDESEAVLSGKLSEGRGGKRNDR